MITTLDKFIKTNNLELGDIILGEEEFNIGKQLKNNIIEVNIIDEKEFIRYDFIEEKFYSKGRCFINSRKVKKNIKSVDILRQNKVWKVIRIENVEYFKGLHGEYPTYKQIFLKDIKSDEIITFYTEGTDKNIINKKFEVIGYEKINNNSG